MITIWAGGLKSLCYLYLYVCIMLMKVKKDIISIYLLQVNNFSMLFICDDVGGGIDLNFAGENLL